MCLLVLLLAVAFEAISVNAGYEQTGLDVHNNYRAKHDSPPLTLDSALNEIARKCAEHYKEKKEIDHTCTDRGDNGENLAQMSLQEDDDAARASVKAWYNEIKEYNFEKPGNADFTKIGHFTQVVWAKSSKLGMGIAKDGKYCYVVAVYSPAGNTLWAGNGDEYKYFKKNVKPPKGYTRSRGIRDAVACASNTAMILAVSLRFLIVKS